jgi:hypothetical protein
LGAALKTGSRAGPEKNRKNKSVLFSLLSLSITVGFAVRTIQFGKNDGARLFSGDFSSIGRR